jgi:hypothetical protein
MFLTIEEFNAALVSSRSDKDSDLLLAALRELAAIKKAEKIVTAILESKLQWSGE